jgi:hypothetical protein
VLASSACVMALAALGGARRLPAIVRALLGAQERHRSQRC